MSTASSLREARLAESAGLTHKVRGDGPHFVEGVSSRCTFCGDDGGGGGGGDNVRIYAQSWGATPTGRNPMWRLLSPRRLSRRWAARR